MDNINKLLNQNPRSLIESKQEPNRENERELQERAESLTDKAWTKLTAMYGHKFASQFGETPDDTWVTCLRGISPRQIADGLNACLESHPVWPPGAAQFRGLCLGLFIEKDGTDSWQQRKMAALDKKPRKIALPIGEEIRLERQEKGNKALGDILGMFDDE